MEFVEKCARSCAVLCNFLRTWLEALISKACSGLSGVLLRTTAQLLAHWCFPNFQTSFFYIQAQARNSQPGDRPGYKKLRMAQLLLWIGVTH